MIHVIDKAQCCGCYACAEICPKKCIDMRSDAEGFWYPSVNLEQCIHCGLCEQVCPILTSQTKEKQGETITAYAVMNKDLSVRMQSSSGGVFSALASSILASGGVVFGAAFDENFQVVHTCVEHVDGLHVLQGSKYVQSKIGDTYRQAETFLKEGRKVFFTGTPCQIEGLLSYLRRPYDNLLTADLICHGVPSPMVWDKYLAYRQTAAQGGKPQSITFRSKREGWKGYEVAFLFDNDIEYRQKSRQDPMMQVFLNNLCLRPSCHACSFKYKVRVSDITLADFWGIINVIPEMDDDRGTSLVIVHSEKGREAFRMICDSISCAEVDADLAISYNRSMLGSAYKHPRREAFLAEISADNFLELQQKYCKKTLKTKIKSLIVRCVRKLKRILKIN